MADQGPPQEGLDPKLGLLTDLAPAEGGEYADDLAADQLARDGLAAFTSNEGELPPQEGRDPKLAACVNDGDEDGFMFIFFGVFDFD